MTILNPVPKRIPKALLDDADTARFIEDLVQAVELVFERARDVELDGVRILSGEGDPGGNVTGSVGDVFLRTDGGSGTTMYVKESGISTSSGWSSVS